MHSCERGTDCRIYNASAKVVWIIPVISTSERGSLPEPGLGYGGDLKQAYELDLTDRQATAELIKLCSQQINNDHLRKIVIDNITDCLNSPRKAITLNTVISSPEKNVIPLGELAHLFGEAVSSQRSMHPKTSVDRQTPRENIKLRPEHQRSVKRHIVSILNRVEARN